MPKPLTGLAHDEINHQSRK